MSLAYVEIPRDITNVYSYAFRLCSSLTDVYYTGTEEEWSSITFGSYNEYLTSATIHYNSVITPSTPSIPEPPEDIPGTVKYLDSWDAASGEAVFGINGIVCSAAEGAEIGAVSEGNFVLVVENASNFLLFDSISPVESRIGTVDSVASSSFTIDGTAYAVTKNLADIFSSGAGSDYLCGSRVLYHISGSCIVGITVLTEKSGSFTEYDAEAGCLYIDGKYYMNSLTDISFLASIGQIIGCNVSILTDGTFVYSLVQLDTEFREVRKLESYDDSSRTAFFADGVSYLLADDAAAPGDELIGYWVICRILNTPENGARLVSCEQIKPEFSVTLTMDNEKDVVFRNDEFAFEEESFTDKTEFRIPFTIEIENVTYKSANTSEDFINDERLAIEIGSLNVSVAPDDLKIEIEMDESAVLKPSEKLTGTGYITAGFFYEPEGTYNTYTVTATVQGNEKTVIAQDEFTIKKKDDWTFSYLSAFEELSIVEVTAQNPVLKDYFTNETLDDIARTLSFYESLRSGGVIEPKHRLKINYVIDKANSKYAGDEVSLYFWIPVSILDVIPKKFKVGGDDVEILKGVSLDQIRFQMVNETKKCIMYQDELLEFSVSANVGFAKAAMCDCYKLIYDEELDDFCFEVLKAGIVSLPGIEAGEALTSLKAGKVVLEVFSHYKEAYEYFQDVFSFSFEAVNLVNDSMTLDIVTPADMEQALKKISISSNSSSAEYSLAKSADAFEVYIYDSNAQLCAVVNNDSVECPGDAAGLFVQHEGESIILWLCGNDFTFEIVPNQTISLAYTIEEYTATDKTRVVCFEDIPLSPETPCSGSLRQNLDIDAAEYSLQLENSEKITADHDLMLNGSGDVDDDGKATTVDARILAEYFAGNLDAAREIINWNAADVDGNRMLTRRDAMILSRFTAGWKGYVLPYITAER